MRPRTVIAFIVVALVGVALGAALAGKLRAVLATNLGVAIGGLFLSSLISLAIGYGLGKYFEGRANQALRAQMNTLTA
jgi:hypothetical protein